MALGHRYALGALGLSLLALGACTALTDFGRFRGGGGGADASIDAAAPTDDTGGRPDTGPRPDTGIPSACMPACTADELCCGDTCVDPVFDPDNCGDCGIVCPDRDHSTPACDELGCDFDCDMGFDDCDGEDSNGCEQQLNTIANCGSCDHACPSPMLCNGDLGTCVSGCADTEMECDGTCVNVMGSDVTHCGSCDACPDLPNTTPSCSAGSCRYACTGAFMDCNGDLGTPSSDGCERMPTTYYADADSDGYGNAGDVMACSPPPGTSAMGGDCNDGNALVNPGASEQCNGFDDDCDRTMDEGFSVGGVEVGGSCSCEPGSASGTVVCESSSRAICRYPMEVCNALDDDCDGVDDDGFACIQGASSTCTGTGSVAGCSYVGTAVCDSACNSGACVALAEECDARDDDCDGFPDDGRLGVGSSPVGFFAPSGAAASDRAVAAAWRSAADGGAVLVYRDTGGSGPGAQQLYFSFFDRTGAMAAGFFWTVSSSTTAERPTGQAALAWDGAQWVVWFGFQGSGGGLEVRRVTITPEPGGMMSMPPVTESSGASVTAIAATRSSSGDVGVVFTRPTAGLVGVWRAGAWARVPVSSISARVALTGAAVVAVDAARFVAATIETSGSSPGYLTQGFTATGPESVYGSWPAPGLSQPQAVFEPISRFMVLAWLEGTEMRAVRWDPNPGGASLVGSAVMPGSGRAPRLGVGPGGDIFVARGPDMQRMQRDTGLLSGESIAPGLNLDVILGTPSAPQGALVFHSTPTGVVSRAVRCM